MSNFGRFNRDCDTCIQIIGKNDPGVNGPGSTGNARCNFCNIYGNYQPLRICKTCKFKSDFDFKDTNCGRTDSYPDCWVWEEEK